MRIFRHHRESVAHIHGLEDLLWIIRKAIQDVEEIVALKRPQAKKNCRYL
jgi:hypothetical protein